MGKRLTTRATTALGVECTICCICVPSRKTVATAADIVVNTGDLTFAGKTEFPRDGAASFNDVIVETAKEGMGLCAIWCCVYLIHPIRLAFGNTEGECSGSKEKNRSKTHIE